MLAKQGSTSECVAHLVGGGLFTSTNPETRRIIPEAVGGRTRLKVVYVVLEAQYQSALGTAVRNINATNDKARCSPFEKPYGAALNAKTGSCYETAHTLLPVPQDARRGGGQTCGRSDSSADLALMHLAGL